MARTIDIQEALREGEHTVMLAEADRLLDLGVHKLAMSDTVLTLDTEHTDQIGVIIRDSLEHFPVEHTKIHSLTGLPTAIARVDCTIGPDGIVPYECDERPAGLGVLDMMLRHHTDQGIGDIVQNHIASVTGSEMVAVHHKDASPNDDHVVIEVVPDTVQLNGHSVLVRGEPHMFDDDRAYGELAARSISTIRTEGSKTYTLRTSAFSTRALNSADELPDRDESFVLKTLQGSKAKGVAIYLSPIDKKRFGKNGNVTHSRIHSIVGATDGPLLIEPFRPPLRSSHGNMILRVIGLVGADGVKVIGGSFVARPETLVHGAKNAVSGLVVPEGVL